VLEGCVQACWLSPAQELHIELKVFQCELVSSFLNRPFAVANGNVQRTAPTQRTIGARDDFDLSGLVFGHLEFSIKEGFEDS